MRNILLTGLFILLQMNLTYAVEGLKNGDSSPVEKLTTVSENLA